MRQPPPTWARTRALLFLSRPKTILRLPRAIPRPFRHPPRRVRDSAPPNPTRTNAIARARRRGSTRAPGTPSPPSRFFLNPRARRRTEAPRKPPRARREEGPRTRRATPARRTKAWRASRTRTRRRLFLYFFSKKPRARRSRRRRRRAIRSSPPRRSGTPNADTPRGHRRTSTFRHSSDIRPAPARDRKRKVFLARRASPNAPRRARQKNRLARRLRRETAEPTERAFVPSRFSFSFFLLCPP